MRRNSLLRNQQNSPKQLQRSQLTSDTTKTSRLTSISNATRSKAPIPASMGQLDNPASYCSIHSRSIELYCMTCATYLCPDCTVFSNHFQHRIVTSREVEGRSSLKNDYLSSELQAFRNELTKQIVKFSTDFQTQKSLILSESQSFFNETIKRLENRKNEAARTITEFFEFSKNSFERKRKDFETFLTDMSQRAKLVSPENRLRFAEQIDVLKRKLSTFTFDNFCRQKISFVVNKDWRETLEQICSLETKVNEEFATGWDDHDETQAVKEVSEPPVQIQPFSTRHRPMKSSLTPERKATDEAGLFRTLNRNAPPPIEDFDVQDNMYRTLSHISGPSANPQIQEIKTPRFNLKPEITNPKFPDLEHLNNNQVFFSTSVSNTKKTPSNLNLSTDLDLRRLILQKGFNRSLITARESSDGQTESNLAVRTNSIPPRRDSNTPMANSFRNVSCTLPEVIPSLNFSNKCMTVDELIKLFKETGISGQISTLDLSSNGITDNGLKRILKAAIDVNFSELNLSNNRLTKTALDFLLSFSQYNKTLRSVILRGNGGIDESTASEPDFQMNIQRLAAKGITVEIEF